MKTIETMKHTPGPWKAQVISGPYHQQIITHPDCRQIALARHWPDMDGSNTDIAIAETEANARLIAAAPELKSALEIALATIERLAPSHRGFDSTRGTKDVVMAAISKAEGRA